MSTRTENRPVLPRSTATPSTYRLPGDDELPPQPVAERRGLVLDLSLAQVLGGSFAAATASAAGSRLGVVGTITGAAVISVVASVASAFYTTSLRHTGRHVSSVLRRGTGPATTRRQPEVRQRGDRRPEVRRLVAGAAVVFALAALVVTGVELVTGRSLDGGSGTTLARTVRGATGGGLGSAVTDPGGRGVAPTPSTGPTQSLTPSATPTPTVTSTATPSASPSPDASSPATGAVAPSTSPTGEASPAPTASSDPSASATTDPTPSASPSTSPTGPSGTTTGAEAPGGTDPLSP
jgi:hypothetical protein